MGVESATVSVSGISKTATAKELLDILERVLGENSVYACEIFSEHKNWKSRGCGRVQFETLEIKAAAMCLSRQRNLFFRGSVLIFEDSFSNCIIRPVDVRRRLDSGILYAGFMIRGDCMSVVESWDGAKAWIMTEMKRIEFHLEIKEVHFKLELQYEDMLETRGCRVGGEEKLNSFLLKCNHGPKIYQKVSVPGNSSRFCTDRYHICKEDMDHLWIRATCLSASKSIGHSTAFCWDADEGSLLPDILSNLPFYNEDLLDLVLEDGEEYCSASEMVPLVSDELVSKLDYEVTFQLNSLVHRQKIPLSSADADLICLLESLTADTAISVLQKLHDGKSICYDPLSFIRNQLNFGCDGEERCGSRPPPPPVDNKDNSNNNNLMKCHRVLVTPSRMYCLGPEIDSSNYVVKNFASRASDFLRISFVEEDWSKIPSSAISTSIKQGLLWKNLRTGIYTRILSVLRDGLEIGGKKFEFLAFSASQLRSNSVWMFASGGDVTAEGIRQWMGSFRKIRSVSKCAARMGQLFSSSVQTVSAGIHDVEIIPDIDTASDGIAYCFSDGVGKISLSFARQVAGKCGLDRTPSVFQIRYGGYKGVVAVDRSSFRKLSLRRSMQKFESENLMLSVTKFSESVPSYLNREIITLMSTLGVEDQVFERKQREQIARLDAMLVDRRAALGVLENIGSGLGPTVTLLTTMLAAGYEPDREPYLSMMLRSHHENQLSDMRNRCRIFVPEGRVLVGCLDEVGVLEYGQVYVRVTMTPPELHHQTSFLKKVDETTATVVGKVVVTKNPCLHPGDIRVLDAVHHDSLEQKALVDCLIFPQKGTRPHPNECSGGDLDGDLFFVSWDEVIIPPRVVTPMDYIGRRARMMDHDVTLEEIHKFFIDYMMNDTLGAISTAHLVHADRESMKAESSKCLRLALLHSMAVDFAKTGAPIEMPVDLKPREYPDFLERNDRPTYLSQGVLGKLYRAVAARGASVFSPPKDGVTYDHDLHVPGFEAFIGVALTHKSVYMERMNRLLVFYGASSEAEILTGNLRSRPAYLQRDNRKYTEVRDRLSLSVRDLHTEARRWFGCSCGADGELMLASAWYHVTYHPTFFHHTSNCLSFPWIVGDVLLTLKYSNSTRESL